MTAPTAPGTNATFSAADLAMRTVQRRAVEAAVWGIPIVNYDLMFQAFARMGGALNQIVYWSKLLDWKNQTTTPNPNSIYFMPFFDTAGDGPIVVVIPPRRQRIDHRHADGLLADRVRGRRPGRQIFDPSARL